TALVAVVTARSTCSTVGFKVAESTSQSTTPAPVLRTACAAPVKLMVGRMTSSPRPNLKAAIAWKRPSVQLETARTSAGGRPMYSPNARSNCATRSPVPSQLEENTSLIAASSASPALGWNRLIISAPKLRGLQCCALEVDDELVVHHEAAVLEPKNVLLEFAVTVDQVDEGRRFADDPM